MEPIFDAFNIEPMIARTLERKVWLKSGGYLIIDQTEALTAIDVNSGKYVGSKTLEDTTLLINLEAVEDQSIPRLKISSRLKTIGKPSLRLGASQTMLIFVNTPIV